MSLRVSRPLLNLRTIPSPETTVKRIWSPLVMVLACGFLAGPGCASVHIVPPSKLHEQQLAPGAKPIAHVYVDCWGIYLFQMVPLITGNIDGSGLGLPFHLFTDSVRVDAVVERASGEAQRQGGTLLTDLQTRDRSYWIAWTLLFWLKEFEVSANVSVETPP
ncbi:MAG: hypothetical protein LKG23_08425 [Nitrospira sp.]|nr:hypothetical protein [Nitrospira sp.]